MRSGELMFLTLLTGCYTIVNAIEEGLVLLQTFITSQLQIYFEYFKRTSLGKLSYCSRFYIIFQTWNCEMRTDPEPQNTCWGFA